MHNNFKYLLVPHSHDSGTKKFTGCFATQVRPTMVSPVTPDAVFMILIGSNIYCMVALAKVIVVGPMCTMP